MIEAGLIPQWINDLIGTKAKKARDQFGKKTSLPKDWAKNLQQDVRGFEFLIIFLYKMGNWIRETEEKE